MGFSLRQMYTSRQLCQRVDVHACGWHSNAMTQTPLWLIANWKMNGDRARVRAWTSAVNEALAPYAVSVTGVFCPPTPYLAAASLPAHAALKLGAQNCHHAIKGAFTGETSASMLADMGCAYVIVGHSERRAMGERDADVLAKAHAAITAGLTPVICVGESRAECDQKLTKQVLETQTAPLKSLGAGSYLIAYEPVWAIGNSVTPELPDIAAAHSHIKSVLGSSVHVLYGGSVNTDNAEEILGLSVVSGALIGGASLEIESMRALIHAAANTRRK
jgi:triosephosphate isomerase (TIM)